MKPKPISSMQRPTCSGLSSMLTPSASSSSAEPQGLVERLPCLATAHPAAAATSAAVVETLKVEGPPPVPAVSTRSAREVSTGDASERIVRARPTRPGTASPFARRAIRKAPVCTPSARPSMISARTASAWSAVRWSPAQTASIALVTTSFGIGLGILAEEVLQQVLALRGEDGLGVELDALGGQLAVTDAHHHVAEAGAELELVGQVGVGDERVIAAGDQGAGQVGVDRPAVMGDLRLLAVDRLALDGAAAEGLDQRLVPEADPQHRRARLGEGSDRLDRDPRLGRRA